MISTVQQYICCLFLCFLSLNGLGQTKMLTPEELAYQQMFDQMIESDFPDTIKLKFFVDSLKNLSYYDSKVPFDYAKKGIALAGATKNTYWSGRLKMLLGRYYVNISEWEISIEYLKSALSDFEKINRTKGMAFCHGLLRYAYSGNNNLEKSLEHCFIKLKIHQEENQESGIGATYNDIAGTYLKANKYEEALNYAVKGKEILMRYKNVLEKVRVTEKIARCHMALGDFEKALLFFNESIELSKSVKIEVRQVRSELYRGRSSVYLETQQYDKALEDIQTARGFFKTKRNELYLCELDAKEAGILFEQKKYKEAKKLFLSVLSNKNSSFTLASDKKIYQKLSKTYAALGQYDSTYFYQLEYEKNSAEEKIHASKLKMEELKTQFETEQKEAIIAAQEKQLFQQKIIQWLSFGFVGVLGLLFFQAYRNGQNRKRNNEELEKTNALLKGKNKENEILLKEIHHRVKNNLQIIASLLNLQSNSITDQNTLDAVEESRNRVNSMALIHQKLYQGDNLAAIEMKDYFETIGQAIIESFGEKANRVKLEVSMSEIEFDLDTAIPIGLITNELITNSLKHAFTENDHGKVSIKMEKEENNLIQLVIADNGKGTLSSDNEKNESGFGSLLVNLLTSQLNGQLERSASDGMVTKIQFPIPIQKGA